MLVGRDASDSLIEVLRGQRVAAVLLGLAFAVLVGFALYVALNGKSAVGLEAANAGGNVQAIANSLFTKWVFAFEVTSILILVAMVGAVVLARHWDVSLATFVTTVQSSSALHSVASVGDPPPPHPAAPATAEPFASSTRPLSVAEVTACCARTVALKQQIEMNRKRTVVWVFIWRPPHRDEIT